MRGETSTTETGTTNAIRVMVVDDQPVVRAAFAALIATQPDFAVAAAASNGREAVELAMATLPDVVLDGCADAGDERN